MPDPTTTAAAATLAAASVAAPTLTLLGVNLGLRPDLLALGFAGSIAAISLLNTVPQTGDTWRELVRTAFKRVGVAVGSALTAGAIAPWVALVVTMPEAALSGMAFIIGAGAQLLLRKAIAGLGAKLDPTGADKSGEGPAK